MIAAKPDISRGKPGLASLVMAYFYGGEKLVAPIAEWLGYEQREDVVRGEINCSLPALSAKAKITVETNASPSLPPPRSYLPHPFWRVTAIKDTPESQKQGGRPSWLTAGVQPPVPEPDAHCCTPLPEQLVGMNRVWPMLINDLTHVRRTTLADVNRIVKRLALGRVLPGMLRIERSCWSDTIDIIVDTSTHLFPFRADFMRLVQKMSTRIGGCRVRILHFSGYPGGEWTGYYHDSSPGEQVYIPPPENGRVMILGDLGVLAGNKASISDWLGFIRGLHRKKLPVFLFTPADLKHYPQELFQLAKIQPWDERARFSRYIGASRRETLSSPSAEQLEEIKILLSCTSLFNPCLLRLLRSGFMTGAPVALESLVWSETDIFRFNGSLGAWKQGELDNYRIKFRKRESAWKNEVLQVVKQHFSGFPRDFQAVQQIIADSVTGKVSSGPREILKRILNSTFSKEKGFDLNRPFLQFFLDCQDSQDWRQDDDLLHTAFITVHRSELEKENPVGMPNGFDPGKVRWIKKEQTSGYLHLSQKNRALFCNYTQTAPSESGTVFSVCDVFKTIGKPLWKYGDQPWQQVEDGQEFLWERKPLYLHTGQKIVELIPLIRSFVPPAKPAWASSVGRDNYGLFAELNVQGIVQTFRWLEPGDFMMGSPEDEPERHDDERLHRVTLSKGFWLADSTVTQELWQLVMGENPSKFKGEKQPVENISWDDAQQFIKSLNKLVPELSVRFPWEAEWEYGCRGGTTTPFSFGDTITPEHVNYDDNHPYNDGEKDKGRDGTVAVKTLHCNSWGLYEMHGNVWEWCQGWYQSDLGWEAVVDPTGPEKGEDRVLRGGSWFCGGGDVRSAFRSRDHPDNRNNDIGFRLARGH